MTSDLIAMTEARRLMLRLSQQALAHELGLTQGHYSKLVRRQVPLAGGAEAKLSAWLTQSDERTRKQGGEAERLAGLITLHANGLNEAVKALLNELH